MCRELRKPLGERAHGGHVLALVCPSDGQVVWSTSSKTTLMWDAGKAGVGMELNGRCCLLCTLPPCCRDEWQLPNPTHNHLLVTPQITTLPTRARSVSQPAAHSWALWPR